MAADVGGGVCHELFVDVGEGTGDERGTKLNGAGEVAALGVDAAARALAGFEDCHLCAKTLGGGWVGGVGRKSIEV